jgi:hypothetical protein
MGRKMRSTTEQGATPLKRILIPAGGAIVAAGMLAAGLVGTASASSDIASDAMAKAADAKAIVDFWSDTNGAALKAAKESNNWDTAEVATKLVTKGSPAAPDTKPGSTKPINESTTTKTQNVNIPRTIGKVFFVNSKGEKRWCSATSVQSNYKNLVATAGHCVYDTATNSDLMSKWVFVPGYYQGKTPFGIYVGKQAFTHTDFDVYEDYDRDYAFVTVYNGINVTGGTSKQVSRSEFKAWPGVKEVKNVEISKDEYDHGSIDPTSPDAYWSKHEKAAQPTGPDFPGAVLGKREVTKVFYEGARSGKGTDFKFGEPITENVTYVDALRYLKHQNPAWNPNNPFPLPTPTAEYPGSVRLDGHGNATITHYWVQTWSKPGRDAKYYKVGFFIIENAAKDMGTLGANVGQQGVSWNQPVKKAVRVFGYPAAPQPDGQKTFTGVTPKNCYGTTTAKLVGDSAKKIEEHVALKCSMTEGADGGPWLLNYKNSTRLGFVNGVTSTFNDQDANKRIDFISSPYFDGETKAVYDAARIFASGPIIMK